jgi:hypothetical protein
MELINHKKVNQSNRVSCPLLGKNSRIFNSPSAAIMKSYLILVILLTGFSPSFSQFGNSTFQAVKVMLLQDSITEKKIPVGGSLRAETAGRLLLEADQNDPRREIYNTQLLVEAIHARGSSAMNVIAFTGLDEFNRSDVLKIFRPDLRSGDRIVLTFKMMSQAKPTARVINIE